LWAVDAASEAGYALRTEGGVVRRARVANRLQTWFDATHACADLLVLNAARRAASALADVVGADLQLMPRTASIIGGQYRFFEARICCAPPSLAAY